MQLITRQLDLERFCRSLAAESTIALDTEFVRERTYFPQLCLIQIATPTHAACIDCVGEVELDPLFDTIYRDDLAWIAHSARQDLEILWYASDRTPRQLIDTQIAAGLLGYAPQIGLQDLLEKTLHVALDKTHTRTDWSCRPLPDEALHYALEDVRHLRALWESLRADLNRLGRISWFEEDSRRSAQTTLTADLPTIFRRLKGTGRLNERDSAAALALLRWRERRAQQANKPRRWILADAVLLDIARRRPTDISELHKAEGLSPRTIAKAGPSILNALETSGDSEISSLLAQIEPDERPDSTKLSALREQVAACSRSLGLEPEVIASKRDLVAMALGRPPEHLATGWRAQWLGLSATID